MFVFHDLHPRNSLIHSGGNRQVKYMGYDQRCNPGGILKI